MQARGDALNDNAKPRGPSTPGQRARAGSAWGRADLLRRVRHLPIPEESRARVARFVEDEIERAREAWEKEAVALAGLQCPKCEKPIDEELRKKRRDDQILAVLKDVPPDEAEKLFQQSRS